MINSNPAYLLQVAEFIQEGKDLIQLIDNADPVKLFIAKQYLSYKNVFNEVDQVYKQSLSNPLTQNLVTLDNKRDSIFVGMCLITDGYYKSFVPTDVVHAKLLNTSINEFGRNLVRANYQSESSSLNSLIDNWESSTDLTAALNAMHLLTWKNELKATNNLFMKTFTDRATTDGEKASLAKIKDLRAKALTTWSKFERILNGKTEEFEDDAILYPQYTALANSINAIFDKYSNLINQRQGRKLAKTETPIVHPANN